MHRPIIITDVCLVDGVNEPRQADVLISDGKLAAFEQPCTAVAATQPGLADIIPGSGRYLVPGLWESHTHMMMGVRPDGSDAEKVAAVRRGLQSYLARGITSVVDLGCPEAIMGAARADNNREESRRHEYPSLYFAGPAFTGVNGWPLCMTCDHTSAWEVTPDSPVEAMVARLASKTDFIKIIYDGLPAEGNRDKFPHAALSRVIRAAHEHGKKAMVHVRTKADLFEAVAAGADGIEHMFQPQTPDTLDEASEAADLMAQDGVFWCPTLTTYEQIAHAGSVAYLERLRGDGIITADEMAATRESPFFNQAFPRVSAGEALARLEYGMKSLRLFADRGVRIVAGSDVAIAMSRPGALLRELQLFAKAGLGPDEVIRTATVNAAERLGVVDGVGGFRVGAAADVILVSKNPLVSVDALVRLENVEVVLKAGVRVGNSCMRGDVGK